MLAISQKYGFSTGACGRLAKGRFVHCRRARGDDHGIQLFSLDGVGEQRLPRV